jgi:undecaprenyl-diphosphatase
VTSTSTRPIPSGSLGRELLHRRELVRLAAVAVGALIFGLLLVLVRLQWVPLESVDHGSAASLNRVVSAHRPLVLVMGVISRIGSTAVLSYLVVIATILLAVRHQYRLAIYLPLTWLGALGLDPALKAAVGRLRPIVAHPVATGGGNSFPSGHSLGSIVGYGALLLVFTPALPRRARRPVIAAVVFVVAAIGFSRLALGVHYLSDVLGAWALGIAWLGITAWAFEVWRLESGERPTEPLAEGLEPEAAGDLRLARPAPVRADQVRRVVTGTVVAWVLVFVALYTLGVPLAKYHKGNGNILGDTTIPHWLAAHRTPTLTRIALLGGQVGNTHLILAAGLIGGAVALAATRLWRPVIFLVVTMFGELTLFLAAQALVDRPRPDVSKVDVHVPTSSYPSGHVAAAICLYAGFVVLAWPRTRAWWRWALLALAILVPLWVAVSRMYQGQHHPTDILGSLVLAAGWLTAMVRLIRPNQPRWARPPASAARIS